MQNKSIKLTEPSNNDNNLSERISNRTDICSSSHLVTLALSSPFLRRIIFIAHSYYIRNLNVSYSIIIEQASNKYRINIEQGMEMI